MFLFFISLTSLSDMRLYEFIFCSVFYVRLRRIREILLRTITIIFTKCSKLEEFLGSRYYRSKNSSSIIYDSLSGYLICIIYQKKSGYTKNECWNLEPVCHLCAFFSTDCADLEYI